MCWCIGSEHRAVRTVLCNKIKGLRITLRAISPPLYWFVWIQIQGVTPDQTRSMVSLPISWIDGRSCNVSRNCFTIISIPLSNFPEGVQDCFISQDCFVVSPKIAVP
jgi:hypothetical protein